MMVVFIPVSVITELFLYMWVDEADESFYFCVLTNMLTRHHKLIYNKPEYLNDKISKISK